MPKEATITDLKYLKTEYLGQAKMDRKVIYDLYCENQVGETFIVELPKARQEPVLEKPMMALIPILRDHAALLLNGSNREVSLKTLRFRLIDHHFVQLLNYILLVYYLYLLNYLLHHHLRNVFLSLNYLNIL